MKRTDKRKKRTGLKIFLSIIVILLLVVGGTVFYIYNHAKNTVDKMHEPVESIDTNLTKKKIKATEPINVLLLGIDSEEGQKGRSDAIMIMRLLPDTDEMKIVSIPRDARTEIIGKGFDDKINHAFAFGGPDMAVATVENFLNIDVDYYVTINMSGLVELVDQLGTITVDNDVEWSDKKYDFPLGRIELNGDQTKAFVRMRKQDVEGDFGRTKRHRKVIEGILREGASVGSIPKFKGMIDILGNNMSTNMDFKDMQTMFSGYYDTRNNITEYMVDGSGQMMDGIYYLIVPQSEIDEAHNILTTN
ncbi:MAG TPA: LCP family protein [Pseudogracilibacillus sp.]|nr:LCP family protein [Pseudogracilibacillus sp.]